MTRDFYCGSCVCLRLCVGLPFFDLLGDHRILTSLQANITLAFSLRSFGIFCYCAQTSLRRRTCFPPALAAHAAPVLLEVRFPLPLPPPPCLSLSLPLSLRQVVRCWYLEWYLSAVYAALCHCTTCRRRRLRHSGPRTSAALRPGWHSWPSPPPPPSFFPGTPSIVARGSLSLTVLSPRASRPLVPPSMGGDRRRAERGGRRDKGGKGRRKDVCRAR